jgi:hypothetical protein
VLTVFSKLANMPLKPIPLAAYSPDFIPPVTGVNGHLAPVANTFDSSGTFAGRSRAGSVKRRREEEVDLVFDRSAPYPPLTAPSRPSLDLGEVKTLLVAATAAGEEVRPLLDCADTDPKLKAFGALAISLLGVVAGIVEKGLVPISGSVSGPVLGSGGQLSGAGSRSVVPPPTMPKSMGLKELREGLEKADRESILFDADLGPNSMGNRSGLLSALSTGIRKTAIEKSKENGADPAEAVRAMDDALACVSDLDFIGMKSDKPKNREGAVMTDKNYCTMPVKFRFEDRNMRLHFERTVKQHCGLRAVMSLPKPIREEQAAFVRAVRERYPGEIVTARPDLATLNFVAFHKKDKETKWLKCSEFLAIPHGILLPNYNVRKSITLPEPATAIAVVGSAESASEAASGSQIEHMNQ